MKGDFSILDSSSPSFSKHNSKQETLLFLSSLFRFLWFFFLILCSLHILCYITPYFVVFQLINCKLLILPEKNFPDVISNCLSLRINSCPNNCSGHGRCSPANSASGRVYCECDSYWKGEACNIPYCKNNCGSPDHGYCDLTGEKLCVCNDSWQGKRFISSWNLNNLRIFPLIEFLSQKLFFTSKDIATTRF